MSVYILNFLLFNVFIFYITENKLTDQHNPVEKKILVVITETFCKSIKSYCTYSLCTHDYVTSTVFATNSPKSLDRFRSKKKKL